MLTEVLCVADMSVLPFFFKRCLLTATSVEFLPKRSRAYTSTISHFVFFSLTLLVSIFSSCESYEKPQKQTPNEIPEQSIYYTHFTFGNVIQDGKQAVFFNFVSDYTITKLEVVGSLLDKDNNVIHSLILQ